jgi:hypothetical protein
MGTPLPVQIKWAGRAGRFEAIFIDVEKPIFQSNVDIRRDSVTDAGDNLPSEVGRAAGKIAVD